MSTNQDPQAVNPLPQGYPVHTGQPPPGVQHETSGGFTDPPAAKGLDLRDLAPKREPIIFPDGNSYGMRPYAELGIMDAAVLERDRARLMELIPQALTSPDTAAEMLSLYRAIVHHVVPDAPQEQIDVLTDMQLKAIADLFLSTVPAGLRDESLRQADAMAIPALQTTGNSSPTSQGSTPDTVTGTG